MICKNCNTLNSNDTIVCLNCGEQLEKKAVPFAAKPGSLETTEIMLDKAPKEISKKNRSSVMVKFQKDPVLLSVCSILLLISLLLVVYSSVFFKISDAVCSPFVNLTKNITMKIRGNDESKFDSLLTCDIIPPVVKSDKPVVRRKMTSIIIKPAEILKDKVMEYYINQKDSMKMILIPAGETEIGSDSQGENEKPLHRVFVNAFFMDQHEVTNSQYRQFVTETGYKLPKFINDSRFNGPEQPVVGISYEDALAYASWSGKRLPTEEEWERAARGNQSGYIYPNGNSLSPAMACYDLSPTTDGPEDVKSFGYNRFFMYEMAGNVAEWTTSTPKAYPNGSLDKEYGTNYKIVKGGCWKNIAADLTVAKRDIKGIKWNGNDIGFRCVMDY